MPSLTRRLLAACLLVALGTLALAAIALWAAGVIGPGGVVGLRTLRPVLGALGGAAAAGGLLAAAIAAWLGGAWGRALRAIAARIEAFPRLGEPAGLPRVDEIARLGRALDAVGASLSSELHRLERRSHELDLLQSLESVIRDGLPLDEILRRIAPALAAVTEAEAILVLRRDPVSGLFEVALARGISESLARRLAGAGTGGEPGVRRALDAGEPVFVPDLLADPLYAGKRSALAFGRLRSATCLPVLVEERAVGGIAVYRRATTALRDEQLDALVKVAGQLGLAFNQARLAGEVQSLSLDVVQALIAAIDAMDPYTAGHTDRVVDLAAAVGQHLGLRGRDLELLRFAAALHDVGKLGVDPAILRKAGPLDPDEWEEMKRHVAFGAQIVERVRALAPVVPIVYHHHEHYNGSGYPAGLVGDEIPLGSRILHVVDAYDAMTSGRTYRAAVSHDEAIRELRLGVGTEFDPAVVRAFARVAQDAALDAPLIPTAR